MADWCEDDYAAGLRANIRSSAGTDRGHLADWLSEEAKAAALRDAGQLTLVSHEENFGIAALDALACGT